MSDKIEGLIPGNTNGDFICLTGAIISWWARIEGMMMNDIWVLRTWPFSATVVERERFPMAGKEVVTHWRKLIENGYRFFDEPAPNLSRIVNESIDLLQHRNNLSHSFWPYGHNDPNVLEVHWVRRDPTSPQGVSRGTYRATLGELDLINTRLSRLYTAVLVASMNSHKLYHLAGAFSEPD